MRRLLCGQLTICEAYPLGHKTRLAISASPKGLALKDSLKGTPSDKLRVRLGARPAPHIRRRGFL
jgi:hypothetical protein